MWQFTATWRVCVWVSYIPYSFNMMMMRIVGSVFFYDAILQPQFGNATMWSVKNVIQTGPTFSDCWYWYRQAVLHHVVLVHAIVRWTCLFLYGFLCLFCFVQFGIIRIASSSALGKLKGPWTLNQGPGGKFTIHFWNSWNGNSRHGHAGHIYIYIAPQTCSYHLQ